MRTATVATRPAPAGGLVIADTSAVLDALDRMTPEELHALDRRIWLADFGIDIDADR
jgi:hypothetical protein